MEETTGMHNPIFSILDGEQKSNFINNMDQMGPLMNQMDNINQMPPLMMDPSMMSQMKINNIPTNQMDSLMEMNNQMMMSMNLMGENMMNYQNNNSNDKGNQEIFDNTICLMFKEFDNIPRISIFCDKDEKVSEAIRRYRIKSNDNNPKTRFIFNSKELKPYLTVSESGMTNNCTIIVRDGGHISGGGFSMMFTDTSKNKTREIQFSKTAPSYREVAKGINIFGICNFKKCKAYKKEVIVKVKKKKFDLIKEREELYCPECEAIIIPKTVGFYLCKFVIYGKKIENGKEESFRNKEDEANKKDSIKYFDPELNGEVMITELVFEVLEYL